MADFVPVNALERGLEGARAGRSSMSDFLRLFGESDVIVPSGSEIMPDGSGFQAVLFDKSGTQMVAVLHSDGAHWRLLPLGPVLFEHQRDRVLATHPCRIRPRGESGAVSWLRCYTGRPQTDRCRVGLSFGSDKGIVGLLGGLSLRGYMVRKTSSRRGDNV